MKKSFNKIIIALLAFAVVAVPFNSYAEPIGEGATPSSPEPSTSPEPSSSPVPSSSPTPTATPTATPVVEPRLAELVVEGYNLDQAFAKDTTNYTVTVASTASSITIKATAATGCTVYSGTGKYEMAEGTKTFTIVAKSSSGSSQSYTIKVTRPSEEISLKSLVVTGYALNETFSKSVYSYTMSIPYNAQSINVSAVAESTDDKVTISGNENLKVGTNEVVIKLTSKSGKEVSYKIEVTREEEKAITSGTSELITSEAVALEANETSSDNSLLKYILITVGCVLLIAIAAIGIIFFIKSESPEKKKAKLEAKKTKLAVKNGNTEVINEDDSPAEKLEEPGSTEALKVEEEMPSVDNKIEDAEVTVVETEVKTIVSEDTKQAPKVDEDILDGMDDIFEDKDL